MLKRMSLCMLISALGLSACAKKVTEPEAPAPAANVAQPKQEELTEAAAIQKISENLRRVHFLFDSHQMTDDSKAALAENARLLSSYPNIIIEVEGHCDQRGTAEYNLALGQRRADAVQAYLVRAGVSSTRIKTITLGMERPLAKGEGESIWAQNRRAEFRVTTANGVATIGGSVE